MKIAISIKDGSLIGEKENKMIHPFFRKFRIKKKPLTIDIREQLENFWIDNSEKIYSIQYDKKDSQVCCTLFEKSQKGSILKLVTGEGDDSTQALLSLFLNAFNIIDVMDISYIRSIFQHPTKGYIDREF